MSEMTEIVELKFNRRIGADALDEKTVSLEMLASVLQMTSDFVYGGDDVSLDMRNGIKPDISHGSLKVKVLAAGAMAAAFLAESSFAADMDALRDRRLPRDDRRRDAFSRLKSSMVPDAESSIVLTFTGGSAKESIVIDHATTFKGHDADIYVDTEFYAVATPMDMGGARNPNIHLRLQDHSMITADSTREELMKNPYLYTPVRVRVACKQNVRTKERKDYVLKKIIGPSEPFDIERFRRDVRASTPRWSGVGDVVAWVRELRGDDEP